MKYLTRLLLSLAVLDSYAAGLLGPIYAIFVARIGGDILEASGTWAAYAIALGVLTIVFGKLEDKGIDKRKAIVLAYVLSAIGIGGYLFVSNIWHLFLVQIILGVSGAISNPAWDAVYSKSLTKKRLGSGWGMYEGGVQIAIGIAAISGGLIATFFGFKALFLVMLALALVGVVSSIFLVKKWREAIVTK